MSRPPTCQIAAATYSVVTILSAIVQRKRFIPLGAWISWFLSLRNACSLATVPRAACTIAA